MNTKIIVFSIVLGLGLQGFSAEIKTYSTATYNQKFATGLKRTELSRSAMSSAPRISFNDAANVPKSSSLRGKTGSIEDQGQCGSCWVFALTSTLRGSWMLAGKDPGPLSFNYLLNCATEMDGCNGGDFPAADHFISPLGAPASGADGSYTAMQGKCAQKPAVASTYSYKLLGTDLGAHPNNPAPSFKDIAYVVGVLHQPVAVDVYVDSRWQSYYSGVFNSCVDAKPDELNHMVVIEGYDCETSVDTAGNCVFDKNGNLPAGVGTWTIRNSWGPTWGRGGYIVTKATGKSGLPCNGIASDALFYDLVQ